MNKLVIFVKAPVPGRVKTRLAASIGDKEACEAYRKLVVHLLGNLKTLPEVELRFSPDDAASAVAQWLQDSWRLAPQGEGDLGQRMLAAFEESLRQGCERVVLIGSDCPAIAVSDITSAWAQLATNDVVLGPATDGGYWLIGARAAKPELFHGITWSGPTVLRETLDRASRAGLRVSLLRELTDVDTVEEWRTVAQSFCFDKPG